jgi:multiple sugar transport system permease protein
MTARENPGAPAVGSPEKANEDAALTEEPGRQRAAMTARDRADRNAGLAFVAPALVTLAVLTVLPGLWVVWVSLQQRIPIFGVARFIGLSNYAFLATDQRFWNATRVTVIFTVVSVGLELALGLVVALGLQRQRTGRRVALSLLLLAWALPSVVTARLFEWLYHPSAGLVNVLLGSRVVNWLGDPVLALPALIVADVWRTMPFVALLSYARLLTIPAEVYEAAAVDGAGRFATFARVTLPLLLPILLITVLFRTLDALRAFDLMFVLTGGGPAATTETLTVYAYRSLFQTLQLGFGSAIGVVVFALVMVSAWGYLRVLRREGLTA